ncbi:hypothetical protein CGRA01v4_00821 [Colletotrichum graminicola]|nr:hypothetical protein CGRA01v4_00821 [Colletotrichum graminicola]
MGPRLFKNFSLINYGLLCGIIRSPGFHRISLKLAIVSSCAN